jgi:hypothetical protein
LLRVSQDRRIVQRSGHVMSASMRKLIARAS